MRYLQDIMEREEVGRAMAAVDKGMGTMVAEVIKISQTPAPTFDEGERADLLEELYSGLGVDEIKRDDVGNVIARVGPVEAGPNIYLTAHMDTYYARDEDHTASLDSEKLNGPSVADNSLGLAVLLCLARVINKIPLKLNSNIHCVSTVGSHGKGYSTGIRAIVEELGDNIDVIIGIEGVKLGRIGHFSQGRRFLDITCRTPGGTLAGDYDGPNAIRVMSEIINKIGGFKLTTKQPTTVNFGFIEGGGNYDDNAAYSRCGLVIRSMDSGSIRHVENRIRFWVNKIAAKTNTEVLVETIRRHPSGSIPEDHFLIKLLKDVNVLLDIVPVLGDASPDISMSLSQGIPSVTLGVTEGSIKKGKETIYINPISTGVKQMLLAIIALDEKWEEYTRLPVW